MVLLHNSSETLDELMFSVYNRKPWHRTTSYICGENQVILHCQESSSKVWAKVKYNSSRSNEEFFGKDCHGERQHMTCKVAQVFLMDLLTCVLTWSESVVA